MKEKLLLTLALAGLSATVALGAGSAAADPVGEGRANPGRVGLGSAAALGAPPVQAPACSNRLDDDGDGLTDLEDPDCAELTGTSEAPLPPPADEPDSAEAPSRGSFEAGATIGGARGGGVVHNETISPDRRGGDGNHAASGGVSFPMPSATAGKQPQPAPANGGAQYEEGGAPTPANPTTTIAPFGAAPIGVSNAIIESFEIPPFLLPIYQACGSEYGIPWQVLAAINKLETGFGANLNVSSAGAVGWMQFLPSTWATYGVDANGDGRRDPYNPVDAICTAARYLKAAGAASDLYDAIFAYNHADWYVQEVLLYARAYGRLPSKLVSSLTGLNQGAHFPIAADARYADDLAARQALRRGGGEERNRYGRAAAVISSSPTWRGINIYSHQGAAVVAVNDGVIKAMGRSARLGKFIVLEDTFGNRYTYAELGEIVRRGGGVYGSPGKHQPLVDSQNLRPRLYALPNRPHNRMRAARLGESAAASAQRRSDLRVGSRVVGGTVIARVGAESEGVDPHINFAILPAGRGEEQIDPKPILDGWKLLEATAIYRAEGKNAFARNLSLTGVLLLSKQALQQRVLDDSRLSIYPCGREDIAGGLIDRRVLAMLEYLTSKGFELTITSLKCGHSTYTTSGYVSEHSTGDAVDIAAIDGVPVSGHQGPGTLADQLIKDVLELQGTMRPHQVISLEDLPGPTSFAMSDHYDHVHVGYEPGFEADYVSPFLNATEGRIDQGVDFTGTGPILAIGEARILRTGAPGWPEGGGVLYQLLDGPRAGEIVFVYEGLQPTVKAGDRVAAGQQIGTFVAGGSIEIGFADADGVPLAHSAYRDGEETGWGRRMADFLDSIGGASALTPGIGGGLSAEKWSRLTRRLAEIDNPRVPTHPSKYALPAGKGKGPAGD